MIMTLKQPHGSIEKIQTLVINLHISKQVIFSSVPRKHKRERGFLPIKGLSQAKYSHGNINRDIFNCAGKIAIDIQKNKCLP